ncbi:MAG: (d)CMP kinase [Thermodesulfobacteriota bacterium]
MRDMVITIDGPAGAGKTTVSRQLAGRLGYRYVDTGALYRGIALAAREKGVDAGDDAGLAALCSGLTLELVVGPDGSRLLSGGVDISGRIRTPEISMMASAVSARPVVREFLLGLQRKMGQDKRAVFEGRDTGTVVFPGADVKFFLSAAVEARALRRFKELPPGAGLTLEQVADDIRLRDHNDQTRSHAPLKPAEDAIMVDSTNRTPDQVVDFMMEHIRGRSKT